MKVAKNTERQLVIEDRPWVLWIVLPLAGAPTVFAAATGRIDTGWGTLLAGAFGLGIVWVLLKYAPFQKLTFNRQAGVFTHDLYRITGLTRHERPLSDIRIAADEGHHRDGARLSRVTLLMHGGRHPLEAGFSSRSTKPVITTINTWLDTGA